jgi:hypothetical protein
MVCLYARQYGLPPLSLSKGPGPTEITPQKTSKEKVKPSPTERKQEFFKKVFATEIIGITAEGTGSKRAYTIDVKLTEIGEIRKPIPEKPVVGQPKNELSLKFECDSKDELERARKVIEGGNICFTTYAQLEWNEEGEVVGVIAGDLGAVYTYKHVYVEVEDGDLDAAVEEAERRTEAEATDGEPIDHETIDKLLRSD